MIFTSIILLHFVSRYEKLGGIYGLMICLDLSSADENGDLLDQKNINLNFRQKLETIRPVCINRIFWWFLEK